jgi:hypothetical protein
MGAEHGADGCLGIALELQRQLAFGIVQQLLGPLVRGADAAAPAELFADAARLAAWKWS